MASWAHSWLLSAVYKDVLKYKLVEEVDADSLSYELPSLLAGPSMGPLQNNLSLTYLSGCLFVATLAIFTGNCYFCLIVGICLLCFIIASIYSCCVLCQIPSSMSAVLKSVKQTHASLKRKEQVTFGLGLSPSYAQRKLRFKVFIIFRSLIQAFTSITDEISSKLQGEKERVLSNFYSKEILQLLTEEVNEAATLINDGGLSTLVNLLSLHISELCRLYLIYFSTLSIVDLLYFFKVSYLFNSKTKSFLRLLREIERAPSVDPVIEASKRAAVKVENCEAVALALNAISSNILCQKLSSSDTKTAVQKVLAMEWFKSDIKDDFPHKNNEKAVIKLEGLKLLPLPENEPLVDQVFEALADTRHTVTTTCEDDFSSEASVLAASLMEELKMALGDRSKEFENRERRALAHFYGITEEEFLEQEMKDKKAKEETFEITGEAVEEPEEWRPQRKPVLASELLQALANRGPIKEAVLGDTSDTE